jgi:hypothetical protein
LYFGYGYRNNKQMAMIVARVLCPSITLHT